MHNGDLLQVLSIADCILTIDNRSGMTATAMKALMNESRHIQAITQPGNAAYSLHLAAALANHKLPRRDTGDAQVVGNQIIIIEVYTNKTQSSLKKRIPESDQYDCCQ